MVGIKLVMKKEENWKRSTTNIFFELPPCLYNIGYIYYYW